MCAGLLQGFMPSHRARVTRNPLEEPKVTSQRGREPKGTMPIFAAEYSYPFRISVLDHRVLASDASAGVRESTC